MIVRREYPINRSGSTRYFFFPFLSIRSITSPACFASFDSLTASDSPSSSVWKLWNVFSWVSVEFADWFNSSESLFDLSFLSDNSGLQSRSSNFSSDPESWIGSPLVSLSLHCFESLLSLPISSSCQSGILAWLVLLEGVEFDFGSDIGVIVGLSGNLELWN